MDTLFIEARKKLKTDNIKIKNISKNLPKKIAIAYSVQYKYLAFEIKKILSANHGITSFIQVLGCSTSKLPKGTDAILFISSGRFHALNLAINTKKRIYLFDGDKLIKISQEEINNFEKKKKALLNLFYNAKNIGILVSTKPGQENLKKALGIKQKIERKFPEKNTFIFLADNINSSEFENFQCDIWLNTACPGIALDNTRIINSQDLLV